MPERHVQIKCKGRDLDGLEVLDVPVNVTVTLSKRPDLDCISADCFNCPFNTGSHGQRCKASHGGLEKVDDGVLCPFSFDYPHVAQIDGWMVPDELGEALRELIELD